MREEEIVAKVVALKTEASNSRKELELRFETYWDNYNGILPSDVSYPWRSRVFMKETFKAVDSIHPIFMDMLFMRGNPFRIKGVDGNTDEVQAKVIESLIKIYIEKMDAYNTINDIIMDMLITGTAFAKIYWKKKTITYTADETTEEMETYKTRIGISLKRKVKKTKQVTKKKAIYDAPIIERVDYKDIFFGTRATNLQDFPIIHRTWKSIEQLKKTNQDAIDSVGEPIYKNLDQLEALANTTARESDVQDQVDKDQKSSLGLNEESPKARTLELNSVGEVEILEYWSADSTKVYTVAGGHVLIRDAENPFDHKQKPFLYVNYIRRPGTIIGIGICELASHGQSLLNTSVNQQIDNNNLANNLMIAADREANVDWDQVKAKPGGIIHIDKEPNERLLDKIMQLKFSRIDTSNEINLAIREIQETTGASRIMQGTYESGAVRNTSQTRLIMGAAGKKFAGKVLVFEEMFLKPFIRQFYSLIRQYMPQDEIINVLGQVEGAKYVKVSKLDICRDFDFIPVGSRQLVEMEQLVHQMNNYLAIASGIPYAPALVNFRYLLKKIWDNMSPDHDGDQVVLSDADAKRAFQEMQALAQMGGATSIMDQGAGKQPGMGGTNASQPNMAGGVQ